MNDLVIAGESLTPSELEKLNREINLKADKLTEPLLALMFLFGIFIAFFYDTWLVAFGVGSLCLIAYSLTKKLLPESNLYQYILSSISAIYAAQYIYQMHGMSEMHFWVFISSAILIIYQNWKLQIPLILIVIVHHATFAYLQYIGYKEIYFTRLAYMDLTTFLFHGVLASCVCIISAFWGYIIHQRTIQDALNYKTLSVLKAELQHSADKMNEMNKDLMMVNDEVKNKNEELKASEEELLTSQEELMQINENLNNLVMERTQILISQNKTLIHHAYINAHKVRSPLARILGLVNLMRRQNGLDESGKDLLYHLDLSANELDEILRELRIELDKAEFKE